MQDECAVCREMAPLACDTHAELRSRERQGYLDALSEHEECSIQCLMHHEDIEVGCIDAIRRAEGGPSKIAYHTGRRDALRELIENRTE